MFADYHVHTDFSPDSQYRMEDAVRDAIQMGIDELCFTDHVDYGVQTDWDDGTEVVYRSGLPDDPDSMPMKNVNYPKYTAEIARLREKYAGQVAIKLGLEFGIQTTTVEDYRRLFQRYPFDFIILSIHQADNLEFWNQDYMKGKTQREYNFGYYREMLDVVRQYREYSVLGHMDMVSRYDKNGIFPVREVEPLIAEILQTVIADGKGIEVNTSSHRYGLPDLTPCREILRLYRELGGEILTLGSDTHRKEHLGAYMDETRKELKTMGFRSFCTYERMKPIFHEL